MQPTKKNNKLITYFYINARKNKNGSTKFGGGAGEIGGLANQLVRVKVKGVGSSSDRAKKILTKNN
jgi:hypothetical protein